MSPEYINISRGLLNDFKNYAARDERQMIRQALQTQLAKNSTRTMTFTDDGLQMALSIIDNLDPTDYNAKDLYPINN
jgi:hypothetical protein